MTLLRTAQTIGEVVEMLAARVLERDDPLESTAEFVRTFVESGQGDEWLDEHARRELMLAGLTSEVYGALACRRAAATKSQREAEEREAAAKEARIASVPQEEIDELHALTWCDWSRCRRSKARRRACVSHLLLLEGQEFEDALASSHAFWGDLLAAEEASRRKATAQFAAHMAAYKREVQIELLQSINLSGVHGTVTLDRATREDLEHMRRTASGQAKAWGLRSEWFAAAVQVLGDAPCLAEAEGDLTQLVSQASRIWKGREVSE